jgi:hypothetical protein
MFLVYTKRTNAIGISTSLMTLARDFHHNFKRQKNEKVVLCFHYTCHYGNN